MTDTLWIVTTYGWGAQNRLDQMVTFHVRAQQPPTAGQINALLRATLPAAVLMYCESDPPFKPPREVYEWRADLVPLKQSALEIMARLSE